MSCLRCLADVKCLFVCRKAFYDRSTFTSNIVPMLYIVVCPSRRVHPVVSISSSLFRRCRRCPLSVPFCPAVRPVVRPAVVVRPLPVRHVVSRLRYRRALSVRLSRRPSRRCRPSSVRPKQYIQCTRWFKSLKSISFMNRKQFIKVLKSWYSCNTLNHQNH